MNHKREGPVRRAVALCLALYAAFLLTAQFEHHDSICHLKTSSHCASCASNLPGADPNAPAILDASGLADAGAATTAVLLPKGVLLPVRSLGRSPPPVA